MDSTRSSRTSSAARLARAFALCVAPLALAGQAFAATYYVDGASVGGACSDAGPGTSSTAPWCSLSKAGSAPAGSTVLVRRATYDSLSLTGATDLRVEGYAGERPTLTNGVRVGGRSLRVTVARFRSTGRVEVTQSEQVVFSDIEIAGNRFGVRAGHAVTIQDSWVHDIPPLVDSYCSCGIWVGKYSGEPSTGVTVRRNRIENLSNDPVQLVDVETATVEGNVLRNAHPSGAGEHVDAVHVLGGSDVVLRRNDARAMQHGLMITDRLPKDGPDADNRAMTVENNVVQTDVGYSFNGPPGPHSWVVNNTLVSPWGTSVRFTDSRDASGTTSAGAVFVNNVVTNRLDVASEIVEDYNLADSGTRRGAQTVIARVSFEPDYALPAGSPAVDSASTAYAPATDLNGYARVGSPDRGAKEYLPFGAPPPGSPPPPGSAPPPAPPAADTTPPDTRIVAGPARRTRSATATFRLVASEAGSRFQCRLDRRRWTTCGARKTYRGLRKGVHTFRARAIDRAGNIDRSPATRSWRRI